MEYCPQIIASDLDGLQVVSACSTGAKVRVSDIKFLLSNKVFLLSIERTKIETGQESKIVNSICRLDFVDMVKSCDDIVEHNFKMLKLRSPEQDMIREVSRFDGSSTSNRWI